MRVFALASSAVLVGFLACLSDSGDGVAPAADGGPGTGDPGGGDPNVPVDPSNPDDAESTDAGPDAAPKPTYKHYDINHVLSTGASDSVANGSPAITENQPFTNLSFNEGVMIGYGKPGSPNGFCDGEGCLSSARPTGFKPLVEGDTFLNQFGKETMSFGLANQASVFAKDYFARVGLPARPHDVLVSVHGRSGNEYWCLRKGPCYKNAPDGPYNLPFDEAIGAVRIAKDLAAAMNKTYVVRAVTAIHGQGDSDDGETMLRTLVRRTDDATKFIGNYTNALIEWQRDYETEIKKVTGQAEAVPLLISQFGSFTQDPPFGPASAPVEPGIARSIVPVRQLAAHVQAPGKVLVVTPNYPLEHADDCNHYSSLSQRKLGAYFAKAYQQAVVEGKTWEPLRPLSVTREGAVITVRYVVPVPPLVFDETRVTNPGNFGYRYWDSTSSATITGVAIVGDTVRVTLSAVPTGNGRVLTYAQNLDKQNPNRCPGPTNGARGNLRDSDPAKGYHKNAGGQPFELFNWAVQSDLDVP